MTQREDRSLPRQWNNNPMTYCIRADRLYHDFFAEPSDEEIGRIFHEGLVALS